MPVVDLLEARDLDGALEAVLTTPSWDGAVQRLRALFVERLDFDPASGAVPLRDKELPGSAARIAARQGVQVVEELDDLRAYDEAKASGDEAIPLEQAIVEIERERREQLPAEC